MVAKAPLNPKQNWTRTSKTWFPIASMPTDGPVVLANDDQTVTWFAEKPSKAAVQHSQHRRGDDGKILFGVDKEPIVDTVDVTPAWYSPASYVDKDGKPV